jgi:hypothetical protein
MNAGWFNLIVFLVLAAVIILCAFNVATYSDIKNGNTNAPDITDGECTAMIVINSVLLTAASLTLIYYIYKMYQNSVSMFWGPDGKASSLTVGKDGKTIDEVIAKGDYTPNQPGTQIFLWLFSTGIFIISLFNLINAYKIHGGSDTNAVNVGGEFIAFSWILLVIALFYWFYTTFRTFVPKKFKEVPFLSLLSIYKESLTSKPTIPSIMPCDCTKLGGITIDDFIKGFPLPMIRNIPKKDIISEYNFS